MSAPVRGIACAGCSAAGEGTGARSGHCIGTSAMKRRSSSRAGGVTPRPVGPAVSILSALPGARDRLTLWRCVARLLDCCSALGAADLGAVSAAITPGTAVILRTAYSIMVPGDPGRNALRALLLGYLDQITVATTPASGSSDIPVPDQAAGQERLREHGTGMAALHDPGREDRAYRTADLSAIDRHA